MYYIVYDSSGNILRSGICQDGTLSRQARVGECVIPGQAVDSRHRIDVSGREPAIVELSAEERAARASAAKATVPAPSPDLAATIADLTRRLAAMEAAQAKG